MPIQFACPHCGKQTTVADQYAGQSGPCAACGKNVTVPFTSAAAYAGPPSQSSGSGSAGMVLAVVAVVLVGGLLVCGGVAVLVAFPMVGQARSAAQRQTSQNNLKQLGLAIHSYHDVHNALPPAVVKDKDGKPLYSGIVLLLPFMEQQNLYQQFDLTKPWNDPANEHISSVSIPMLMNPASPNTAAGHCDYLLIGGPNAALADDGKKSSFANVRDGTSNTIMAVEVGSGGAAKSWAQPMPWDASQTFDSPHPTVVNVLFADGSVRPLQKTTPVQTLRFLSDRQDGQAVNVP